MTIPHIHTIRNNNVNIPNITHWMIRQPTVDHLVPPVVLQIGNPIVNMPGCVKMHKDNQYHNNGIPIDKGLIENDPDRVMTVCDAEYPSYDAMNYEPEQLIITREAEVPPVAPPPEVEPPEVPPTGDLGVKGEVPCPGPAQLRIGDVTQSGDERVIGHRLIENGKTCETLYEPTTVVEKFLPPVNQATSVTALAVVATAGAAATPLLIRVIRPVIKKLWTTIQKKLGKDVKRPSMSEVKTNKYREKKGLPPIKRK